MEMNTEAARLANEWGREALRLQKDIKRLNKAIEAMNGSEQPELLKLQAAMSIEIAHLAEEKEAANDKMKKYLSKLYAI